MSLDRNESSDRKIPRIIPAVKALGRRQERLVLPGAKVSAPNQSISSYAAKSMVTVSVM